MNSCIANVSKLQSNRSIDDRADSGETSLVPSVILCYFVALPSRQRKTIRVTGRYPRDEQSVRVVAVPKQFGGFVRELADSFVFVRPSVQSAPP